jgi:small-conductance mechanosensitive channel
MDANLLRMVIAAGLAVALEVVPGLAHAWESTPNKRTVIFVVFAVLPALAVTAACFGVDLHLHAVCDRGFNVQSVIDAAVIGIEGFLGSQLGFAFATNPNVAISLRQKWQYDDAESLLEQHFSSILGTLNPNGELDTTSVVTTPQAADPAASAPPSANLPAG